MERKTSRAPTKDEIRMNLAALQRIDPFITKIVQSASQVALYKYISNEWDKTEIEGTLFVYKRKCEPKFGFLILNRRSTSNWIQPVSADIDTQIQTPFLLYKTKEGEIFGIWFYEQPECEQVGETLKNLIQSSVKSPRMASGGGNADLASLLQKAEIETVEPEKKKPVAVSSVSKPSPSGGEKLLRLLSREPEPKVNHEPNSAAPSCGSVAAFFAQASQQEQNTLGAFTMRGPQPQGLIPGFIPPGHQQTTAIFPFNSQPQGEKKESVESQRMLQNLLSSPGVVSVELLERAQRAESRTPNEMPPMPMQATKADDLESDLKSKLQLNQNRSNTRTRPVQSGNKMEALLHGNHHPQPQQHYQPGPKPEKSQHQPKQLVTKHPQASNPNQPQSYASALLSGADNDVRVQPSGDFHQDPSIMFYNSMGSLQTELAEPEVQLMSPMVFAAIDSTPDIQVVNGNSGIEPLTKGQFVQALVHLLRTDDQFVGKLHQAYVETLNTKLH